jgi:sec-independent protein translocase protein TatC
MSNKRTTKDDEDLFKESTMTFGEHLEELRSRLFKAVFGLLGGVIVGLIVGNQVVAFIKTPLENALNEYYQKQSLEAAKELLGKLQEAGRPLAETPEQIKQLIYGEDPLLPQEVYVNPVDLLTQLKDLYPDQFGRVELPAKAEKSFTKEGMMPLLLWHRRADDSRVRVKSLNAQEAFTIYIKAALLIGVIVGSPVIFYQIWSFVAAGLYSHERHYVRVYLPFSLGLFFVGAFVAFKYVFPRVLGFLFNFNSSMGIDPDPRMYEWLSFFLILPLGFGIGFQLPLVMFFLERIGIFTVASYKKQWRIAVLVIFVAAALLTPPDPYSMCLLAFPLTFLYFGGILLCKWMPRRNRGEN